MSGIVGMINLDGAPVDRDLLGQMTSYMTFRGPDHQDLWLDGNVGFGHTLLRTTFESEDERGVTTLDGQVWITADVRLDGRTELMAKLCAKGAQVAATATDVELVLHAYELWGEAALDHLMGDFAFGLWDGRRQRLFCAHDHFGVMPFYYAQVQNCLLFSNTLNVLRLHPAVMDTLNEQAIGDFLLFMMNMDLATTTFVDIQRLPPAHALSCADSVVAVHRYYQLPAQDNFLHYKRQEEYVAQFQELFEQAVADRLRTHRAGTFLSGGMDSTSIAATAQKQLRQTGHPFDFRAYTIVYDQLAQEEEGRYARMVAEACNLHTEYLVADSYMLSPPVENSSWSLPEPLLIPNQAAEWEVTARVATYGRVLFTGFGGDPLFMTMDTLAYWQQLLKRGQLALVAQDIGYYIKKGRRPSLGIRTKLSRLHNRANAQPPFPIWFQPDFVARQRLHEQWLDRFAMFDRMRGLYGMMSAPLWSWIFANSDPGVTSFPVRLRFPFFDLRLARYLLRVPPGPLLERKQLLRTAMQGLLPDSVRQRPKTPLGISPYYTMARKQGIQPWASTLLATPTLNTYVNPTQWRQQMQNADALTPTTYGQFVTTLPLAYWLRSQDTLGFSGTGSPQKADPVSINIPSIINNRSRR